MVIKKTFEILPIVILATVNWVGERGRTKGLRERLQWKARSGMGMCAGRTCNEKRDPSAGICEAGGTPNYFGFGIYDFGLKADFIRDGG